MNYCHLPFLMWVALMFNSDCLLYRQQFIHHHPLSGQIFSFKRCVPPLKFIHINLNFYLMHKQSWCFYIDWSDNILTLVVLNKISPPASVFLVEDTENPVLSIQLPAWFGRHFTIFLFDCVVTTCVSFTHLVATTASYTVETTDPPVRNISSEVIIVLTLNVLKNLCRAVFFLAQSRRLIVNTACGYFKYSVRPLSIPQHNLFLHAWIPTPKFSTTPLKCCFVLCKITQETACLLLLLLVLLF